MTWRAICARRYQQGLLYRWPYEQMNFFRWQSIFYVNGFFFLVFGSHFFLNWFLSMGHGDKHKNKAMSEEHIPLFGGAA